MKRNELLKFGVWMRNGIAFVTTWFLILILIYFESVGVETVGISFLVKMFLFVVGGVLMFSLIFTKLVLKRCGFTVRLSCFMLLFGIYETFAFYSMGIFKGTGTPGQWLAFWGIVMGLYGICIGINEFINRKKGKLYTRALKEYQEKRRVTNE